MFALIFPSHLFRTLYIPDKVSSHYCDKTLEKDLRTRTPKSANKSKLIIHTVLFDWLFLQVRVQTHAQKFYYRKRCLSFFRVLKSYSKFYNPKHWFHYSALSDFVVSTLDFIKNGSKFHCLYAYNYSISKHGHTKKTYCHYLSQNENYSKYKWIKHKTKIRIDTGN